MGASLKAGGQQQDLEGTYLNQYGSRIPFHSRIGTKLILGFLVIAIKLVPQIKAGRTENLIFSSRQIRIIFSQKKQMR